jgi:hypothetical protein
MKLVETHLVVSPSAHAWPQHSPSTVCGDERAARAVLTLAGARGPYVPPSSLRIHLRTTRSARSERRARSMAGLLADEEHLDRSMEPTKPLACNRCLQLPYTTSRGPPRRHRVHAISTCHCRKVSGREQRRAVGSCCFASAAIVKTPVNRGSVDRRTALVRSILEFISGLRIARHRRAVTMPRSATFVTASLVLRHAS